MLPRAPRVLLGALRRLPDGSSRFVGEHSAFVEEHLRFAGEHSAFAGEPLKAPVDYAAVQKMLNSPGNSAGDIYRTSLPQLLAWARAKQNASPR